MPEYLAPGVYVEEVSFRPKSIEGVSTSTTAMVGPARQGPVGEVSDVITSFGEFARIYGGLENLDVGPGSSVVNYLAHAVRNFYDNGGRRLYIARTFQARAGSAGVAQSASLVGGGATARFVARSPGAGLNGWVRPSEKRRPVTSRTMGTAPDGSLLNVDPRPAVLTGNAPPYALAADDTLTLQVAGGPLNVTFAGPSPAVLTGAAVDFPLAATTLEITVGEQPQSIAVEAQDSLAALVAAITGELQGAAVAEADGGLRFTTQASGPAASLAIQANAALGFAADSSASGAGNVADLGAVTIDEIQRAVAAQGDQVRVLSADGRLAIQSAATGDEAALTAGGTARPKLGLPDTQAGGAGARWYVKQGANWTGEPALDPQQLPAPAALVTLNLEIQDQDGNQLFYEDLGFAPAHPRYVGTVLIEHPTRRSDALLNPVYFTSSGGVSPTALRAGLAAAAAEGIRLSGGDDGIEPGVAAYEAALESLETLEDISIVAAPGHSAWEAARAIGQAVISHAERMRYRIAVLDSPPGQAPGEVRQTRSFIDSKYAAFYYPWVVVANPLVRPGDERIPKEIALPPSGFLCGIYARNDTERGVWKAPANEIVRGALRFEREINHAQQEVLNPEGINCLRYFYGRGNRVWGARLASSDPEWKYVNMRRYFIYLERSIDRGTQWAVFEPNGERLWANIRETVSAFLFNEWRSGALLGSAPEDAYFVRCDRSTMTQNDLDNGRLICEIGVAVLTPAEFVIFRIGQKTADARD